MQILKKLTLLAFFFTLSNSFSQDYFFEDKNPFDSKIPTPEEFLGYPIGEQHTRHDQIVSYLIMPCMLFSNWRTTYKA